MSEVPSNATSILERLKASIATSGFSSMLSAEPIECADGKSELVIELRPELRQHHGFAHGAVVGAAADNACAWAAASVAGDVVTASYTIQFCAPAKGERLRAFGQVLSAGKRQVSVRADVYCESGDTRRLVATALASIAKV